MATNRYTDEDLAEFKTLIEAKLAEAKVDLKLLQDSLSHKGDHGTDDTSRSFNMMEDGSETLMREEMAQLSARQEKFVKNLENALRRIENKSYRCLSRNREVNSKSTLKISAACDFKH